MPFFQPSGGGGSIPYPEITGVESISDPNFVQFNVGANSTFDQGRVGWDIANGSLQLGLGDSVGVHLGEETVTYVINKDVVPILKGQVIYLFGAQGDKPSIKLASNLSDNLSAKTFGVALQDMAVNELGYVMNKGQVDGLSLGTYATGDIVYLGATAGSFTNVKPYAPNHNVFVGVVLRANNGNGILYVQPQNGYELDELHTVSITTPQNEDVLEYETSSGLWKNQTQNLSVIERAMFKHMDGGGIEIVPRIYITSNFTTASSTLFMTFFTAPDSRTVTQLSTWNNTLGSGCTYAAMGLYSWDVATGTATLLGSTASDTNLHNSTGGSVAGAEFIRALTAPVSITKGTLYAVGFLWVGTTAPSLISNTSNVPAAFYAAAPRICASKATFTTLPATATAFTNNTRVFYGRVI